MLFADLLFPGSLNHENGDPSHSGNHQKLREAQLPELLTQAGFVMWSSEPVHVKSTSLLQLRIVIGFVPWSVYDLRFLDQIHERLPQIKSFCVNVEVFNIDPFQSLEQFEERIPGLGMVYQTPVVGVWRGERQIAAWQGGHARANTLELLQDLAK